MTDDSSSPQQEAPQPRWQPLSAVDRRVAGVLVEKAKTTPNAYPLSLSAICTACNQKSNRSPVMTVEPDDAEANQVVGAYYCFVKGQWEKGLPILARGSDLSLAELAVRELDRPTHPDQQVALADSWWQVSDRATKYRTAIRQRAADWYHQALPQLTPGLELVRAEVRMRQVEQGPN